MDAFELAVIGHVQPVFRDAGDIEEAFFQQLGQLRKGQEPLRLGDISFFEAGDGKLGFTRSVNSQTLRIYVNHSMDAWQVPVGRVLFGHHIHTLAPTWLSLSPMGFCVTREE